MKKRIFATLLALVMALGLTATTWADEATTATNVSYVDATDVTQTCPTATIVTSTTGTFNGDHEYEWSAGWYVVNSHVTINDTVKITGNVNLILCDAAELTVNASDFASGNHGIKVESGCSLTVYGQTNGSGSLSAEGSSSSNYGIFNGGTLTINGGMVTATGSESVGLMNSSILTINGGVVTATGTGKDNGIANSGTLTINGGMVTATGDSGGGSKSAGIFDYSYGSVVIKGGTVKATGVGNAVRRVDNATLTLPTTTYWWRTAECGDFTASTTATYAPGAEKYAEITTQTNPVNTNAHQIGTWVEGTPATCTANGTKGHKDCSVCGKNFDANGDEITDLTIDKDLNNHVAAGVWHSDSKNHWMTYETCCNFETEKTAHSFDGCTCTVCGYEQPVHEPIRRQHVTAVEGNTPDTDTKADDTTKTDTVTSAKTFDTGIAVYGAMAIASLLGMGYVGKKRV